MQLIHRSTVGVCTSLVLVVALACRLGAEPPSPDRTQVDPVVSAATKWRDESISKLEDDIKQSTEAELALIQEIQEMRRSGSKVEGMAEKRKQFANARLVIRKKIANLKKLNGIRLGKAYQDKMTEDAARLVWATEQRREAESQKDKKAFEDRQLARAREIFGDVELSYCPFCGPTGGICNQCAGTKWTPKWNVD